MKSTARLGAGKIAAVASLCLCCAATVLAGQITNSGSSSSSGEPAGYRQTQGADAAADQVAIGPGCPAYGDFARCRCRSPEWTVAVDAVFVHRDAPSGYTMLTDVTSGRAVLDASQMGLGTQAGPRLILLGELGAGWTLDLEYLGIDGWSVTEGFGPGDYLVTGDRSVSGPDASVVSFLYASRFRTAEINLRTPGFGWLRPLAGFRWIGLSETYQAAGEFSGGGAGIPYVLRYQTDNNLYGGQLGAAASLWDQGGPITVTALGKAGLYLADSLNAGTFRATAGTETLAFDAVGHGRRAAFFGELGVVATWWLNEHLSVRGGYQLYWLTDVALAIEQPLATDIAEGTGGINNRDNLFMHGPSAGLQLSW